MKLFVRLLPEGFRNKMARGFLNVHRIPPNISYGRCTKSFTSRCLKDLFHHGFKKGMHPGMVYTTHFLYTINIPSKDRSKVFQPSAGEPCCIRHLRFGRALSKLRSSMAGKLRKEARESLKKNLATYRSVKRNTRADSRWIKAANLNPIFDFLA